MLVIENQLLFIHTSNFGTNIILFMIMLVFVGQSIAGVFCKNGWGLIEVLRITHLCPPFQHLLSERLTFLGIMGAPRVPPLNPPETIVLSEHYRIWIISITSANAPASHVRRVRVPSQASDVDQYVDELFIPIQDSPQDDISDVRSLAQSIRGGGWLFFLYIGIKTALN